MATTLFLHGLDSSSRGTKGRYFADHFPAVIRPDFQGDLNQRLLQLDAVCAGQSDLTLIGSSFGGLMATCFAINHAERIRRLILLAPALNFSDFKPPQKALVIPTLLVMGRNDTVCPPRLVEPLARATFSNITVRLGNDDHLLHTMFYELDWPGLLG